MAAAGRADKGCLKCYKSCNRVRWEKLPAPWFLDSHATDLMPLYEYHCEDCGANAELLIRGDEVPECPQCGSQQLAKQLSVPAAHSGRGGDALPVMPPGGG